VDLPPAADECLGSPLWPPAPSAELGQPWRASPEDHFRPARVWVAWTPSALHILAELEDDDIANSARGERQATWETGDVFEIFLRPEGQEAYFEFHVTPENETLRVRFPSAAYFDAMASRFPRSPDWVFDLSLAPDAFQSAVHVDAAARRWRVCAVIPCATVLENGDESLQRPWLASFCRYDTTRGVPGAALSTTSPHPGPVFHQQSDWRPLHFLPCP
jgi:hypothetical protein